MELSKATAAKISNDNVSQLAAAFGFYGLLSISPFLVFAVRIAGLVFGGSAGDRLLKQAADVGGPQLRDYVAQLLASAQTGAGGVVALLLSLGVSFWGASNLFIQLDQAIDVIWSVKTDGPFLKSLIFGRLIAFLSVLIFGSILVSWLILDSLVGRIGLALGSPLVWHFVSYVVASVFLFVAFLLSFRALPRKHLTFKDVWLGALVSAIGIATTKLLLSLYFSHSSGAYGATGGVIVLLLWLYYSTMIYLIGMEVACAYATSYGSLKEGVTAT